MSPPSAPTGHWNRVQVTVQGTHIRMTLNGQLVTDETLTPRQLRASGPIALQIQNGQVEFRNLFVRELP
jgi:hypothetical protein